MASLATNTQLYAHLAVLRRRVLFRHYAAHAALGTLAVLMLLIGIALLNVALFLSLRQTWGDIPAVLVVAVVHLGLGGVMLVFTTREPASPELDALADAEAAALSAVNADTRSVVDGVSAAGERLGRLSSDVSLGIAALSGLQSLLSRQEKPAEK
jgi:hypothetical protein